MSGRKTPNGYEIKKFVLFENNKGFALGENPSEPEPFATWQFTDTNGKRDYYWGHYKKTLDAAEKDFAERVAHYKQMYFVAEQIPQSQMQFRDIEHYDRFDDVTVFWIDVFGLPPDIQQQAKQIDKTAYDAERFGICVNYSVDDDRFVLVTDTDLSTGRANNVFYIDNFGDKHWFLTEIPDGFIKSVFAECRKVLNDREEFTSISNQLKEYAEKAMRENASRPTPLKKLDDKGR